jgi:transcriptional regulator with XRE-family HTH domain
MLVLRPEIRAQLAERDIGSLFRALQRAGVTQRIIAAKTGQSQSEISEILAGRQVLSIALLERIVDGLGIDRRTIGLVQPELSADPVPVTGITIEPGEAPPRVSVPPIIVQRQDEPDARVDVPLWTARDVWALRQAMRFGRCDFGKHLGVSSKLVKKWEGGAVPSPFQQGLLDTALSRLDPALQSRFARLATEDIVADEQSP